MHNKLSCDKTLRLWIGMQGGSENGDRLSVRRSGSVNLGVAGATVKRKNENVLTVRLRCGLDGCVQRN